MLTDNRPLRNGDVLLLAESSVFGRFRLQTYDDTSPVLTFAEQIRMLPYIKASRIDGSEPC